MGAGGLLFLDASAAAARRGDVLLDRGGSYGDRPSRRRSSEHPSAAATVGFRAAGGLVLREADAPLDVSGGEEFLAFEGFASVYEPPGHGDEGHVCRGYEMYDQFGPYLEFVHPGAGAASLAQDGLDVPLVLGHDTMKRLARTNTPAAPLYLSEVNEGPELGLKVDAPSLKASNPWVAEIRQLLEDGLIDEMSFRFRITAGRWSEDWDEYHINAFDIHKGDVSIVGYGANPYTAGAGLRTQGGDVSVSEEFLRLRLALALTE